MKRETAAVAALALAAASVVLLRASDRVAVYAKVDRVVLTPNADAADAVQIWGAFSVAVPNNPSDYAPAARGYLYFSPGKDREAARREWLDLKTVAGTGQIVAFGSRWEGPPRLRRADETPAAPDAYAVNTGVTKVQGRTDYAPIRALIDVKP